MKLTDIGESVAGPENCWPGHRKVGTKPGTGKNAGKRVNDCEKIKEDLNEFAPGSGGGESGRWYTDDQMTDIVGDGWWNDLDVSGDIPKQQMIQEAQAWLDDQGYDVQVLNCKLNDDDMEWYIEGSFQNSNFAKKGVAEGLEQGNYNVGLEDIGKPVTVDGESGYVLLSIGYSSGNGKLIAHALQPDTGSKGTYDLETISKGKQGVAEGGYPEVDHMPGPTIKRTQTGCKRCHGKGYVYKTPDGETHPMNRPDAKKYKCGKCNGIGFVKVGEGMLDNPGEQDSPVAQAIIRRILLQRTDLLAKHGPEKVGQAVDEVADFVGDVDEIGSSDVSGWVRHVEQLLGNMEQDMSEVMDLKSKTSTSNSGSGEFRGVNIPTDMKHPEWREPTWSFQEIARKLGIPTSALSLLAFKKIGGFPEAVPGISSKYGGAKYYKQSEVKRWVNANQVREKLKKSVSEGTGTLNVGDDVIITGAVKYKGATGVVDSVGRDGNFIVVNLYNHGNQSFQSTDVSLNDYAGSEAEESEIQRREMGESTSRSALGKAIREGAKVDRMVKHIAKSERAAGKSKDEAEDIAWATANKRGMLDNKNKKTESTNARANKKY